MSGNPNANPEQEPAEPPRPGRKWTVGVAALIVVFVALAAYGVVSGGIASAGRPSAPRTAAQAAPSPTVAASARSATPVASPGAAIISSPAASASPAARATSSPAHSAVRASVLTVASAAAYGPDGTSDGDHPGLAPGIVNGGDGQAWNSSWYASPEFGNLQSGTGLMLDMGETVNLSRVQLVLGAPVGRTFRFGWATRSRPARPTWAAPCSCG